MRNYLVSRKDYEAATTSLLEYSGFDITTIGAGKLLIKSYGRLLYIDVAGKYLPYYGHYGQECFPWETHVSKKRLDQIEQKAKTLGAEPWLCLCYFIRDAKYKKSFDNLTNFDTGFFGIKLIHIKEYKLNMRPRSRNSWDVVELPRTEVLQLTIEANKL